MATAVTPPPASTQRTEHSPVSQDARGVSARRVLAPVGFVLGGLVVVAGLVARFLAPNGLWLDEALSVNIARLPLTQMPGALVQDGSPPLYYLMLHCWMLLFGQGEVAVRSLSAITSVITVPFLWFAGRRLGGRRAAWAALLLGATSPWAIYYGSYTRMYSLMALESVLFYLALRRAVEFPSHRRLACVGLLTAVLMYTHYWDFYLLGVVGLWALWRARAEVRSGTVLPGAYPGAARKILWSMVAGALLFVPWSPVFVFQVMHTGSPWSAPPGPATLISVLGYFSGQGAWAQLLTFIFFVLAGLALFARPGPRPTSVLVELVPQPSARFVGLLLVGTLIAAVVVGALTGAAFDQRYIAVVFPLFVILCALGLTTFGSRTVTAGVLAVACVAGLMSARQWDSQPRTEAVKVAADLNQEAQAGDVVVYCPDQLGPAVDRLLTVPGVTELTYPRMLGPQRVDWVNYLSAIRGTSTQTFAHEVVGKLDPGNRLWLVWRNGYLGFGGSCGNLASWLDVYLPGGLTVLGAQKSYYEYENLTVYPS